MHPGHIVVALTVGLLVAGQGPAFAQGAPEASGTAPAGPRTPFEGMAGGEETSAPPVRVEQQAAPMTGQAAASPFGFLINWATLSRVRPQPTRTELPPWWKLLTGVGLKPQHAKASIGRDSGPERQKAGNGKDSGKSQGADAWGSLQQRICRIADDTVGKPFPYAPGTENGNLGCADVASTILKKAGAIQEHVIGVLALVPLLHNAGWKDIKPPPYQDGDVVTWYSYDRTGDGKVDPDTHVGIISIEGGTVYAIQNSSSQRKPIKLELSHEGYPICRVMRAA